MRWRSRKNNDDDDYQVFEDTDCYFMALMEGSLL